MIILNQTKDTVISAKASVAKTFWQRFMGLMFRDSFGEEEALIFYRAESIHMFFMRFPIDVLFLDKDMRVIRLCAGLKPWQMAWCMSSTITIELPADKAERSNTATGDMLKFLP